MSENLLNVDEDDFIVSDVPINKPTTNNHFNEPTKTPTNDTFNINARLNDSTNTDSEYLGTLNESVATTLLRDANHMKTRMLKVLYPSSLKKMFLPMTMSDINEDNLPQLNPDFDSDTQSVQETSVTESPEMWAPLILNLIYSKILSDGHNSFAFFFLMTWVLMGALSFHLKVYNKISILGKISLLLYCFFPVVLNSILIKLILNPLCLTRFFMKSDLVGMKLLGLFIKISITFVTTLWCFYSCLVQLWKDFSDSESSLSVDNWSTLFSFQNLPVFITYLFLNWVNVL
ncbi:hypothetical protein ACO0SA_004442 [Hanseniaspora valbyensis]